MSEERGQQCREDEDEKQGKDVRGNAKGNYAEYGSDPMYLLINSKSKHVQTCTESTRSVSGRVSKARNINAENVPIGARTAATMAEYSAISGGGLSPSFSYSATFLRSSLHGVRDRRSDYNLHKNP